MRGLSRSIVIQSYVTNQKGIIFSNLIHFCNQRLPLFVNPQHSRAQHVLQHNGMKYFLKEHLFYLCFHMLYLVPLYQRVEKRGEYSCFWVCGALFPAKGKNMLIRWFFQSAENCLYCADNRFLAGKMKFWQNRPITSETKTEISFLTYYL